MLASIFHHKQESDHGLANRLLGGDADMRPVLCPGENFDPKLSQQPDGVDTRGVVQRFGADGCVGSVRVDVRPD